VLAPEELGREPQRSPERYGEIAQLAPALLQSRDGRERGRDPFVGHGARGARSLEQRARIVGARRGRERPP